MNGLKIAKIIVQTVTIVASVAMSIIADKNLNVKVAEEVAKQLADKQ